VYCGCSPICVICFRKFNPDQEGGLIYFRQTKKGIEFARQTRITAILLTLNGFVDLEEITRFYCHAFAERRLAEISSVTTILDDCISIAFKDADSGKVIVVQAVEVYC